MQQDVINIGLAFIEGLALILSPCILPVLPIILASSIEGNKRRPIGVIVGFVASFSLFTFFSRKLVLLFGIDLDLIRNICFALLLLFGLIMISSYLTEKFSRVTQVFANLGLKLSTNNKNDGFNSGLMFGTLIGLIWTPCAGPILAAVLIQSILQQSNLSSFLTILAFGIGAAAPMAIIIIFGRKIMRSVTALQNKAELIRKILGLIIIVAILVMIFADDLFSTSSSNKNQASIESDMLVNAVAEPYNAPDFKDITAWINSKPLQIDQLHGKVVLIDFWAYSCINCIRTLPYLTDWDKKYHKQGLVIVGVHAPEFDFERKEDNVRTAVTKFGIHYPVALDNNFATWKNFNNHYWPAHYLIDKTGNVVYEHFGEGDYNVTENNIRYLLGINGPMSLHKEKRTLFAAQTPETYLGYARSDNFHSPEKIDIGSADFYTYPTQLLENAWALNGLWTIAADKIINQKPQSAIKIHFSANNVFAVMGTTNGNAIKVEVLLNGSPLKTIEVKDHTLYPLLELKNHTNGLLELIASEPGLEIYTFTFG